MPQRKVVFAAGEFYHVFNRGNNKNPIFYENRDYRRFLEKIKEYKEKYGVSILCHALMSNHFHLLLRQLDGIPLSRFVGDLLNSHARYIGIKNELPGHLFQGRFKAKHIASDEYLFQLSRYIHLHPIKDKILTYKFIRKGKTRQLDKKLKEELRNYLWSSYKEYLSDRKSDLLDKEPILAAFKSIRSYQKFVEAGISSDDILEIEGTNNL